MPKVEEAVTCQICWTDVKKDDEGLSFPWHPESKDDAKKGVFGRWLVCIAWLTNLSSSFFRAFTRIDFYLLSHGTTPSFKLLFALIPVLTYFFLLQLGTAYQSAALSAAPAVMEEKELEETWEAGAASLNLGNSSEFRVGQYSMMLYDVLLI